MFDLMYEHEGVGLAANQVDLPYRVFVANVEGDRNDADAECVFINPVILRGSGQAENEEGCLSIPGVYAPGERKEKVTVQAYNLAGEEVAGDFEGLFARIVQHEIDHLDGTAVHRSPGAAGARRHLGRSSRSSRSTFKASAQWVRCRATKKSRRGWRNSSDCGRERRNGTRMNADSDELPRIG